MEMKEEYGTSARSGENGASEGTIEIVGSFRVENQRREAALDSGQRQRSSGLILNSIREILKQCVGFAPENNGLEKALEGAELVIIPAGMPRKPGMTRDDLFNVRSFPALALPRS